MRHLLAFFIAMGLLGDALAAESAIAAANRQLLFSVGRHKINYVEYDNYGVTASGVLDSENGSQNGGRIGFVYQTDTADVSNLYLAASYMSARGKTKYDGHLQSFTTGAVIPYQTTSHSTTTDFQLKVGKGFAFANDRLQLTPYVSYAYHEWVRDSRTDTYGYLELYQHQAVGLGVLGQFALTPRLVGSVDVSHNAMIDPEMEVDDGPIFYLKSKSYSSIGLGLDYALSAQWRVHADYRYTRFKYGESPVVGGFLEPSSRTVQKTFFVGVGLAF